MPLSEDGIDRLTRELWRVDRHVHPPQLVWWYDDVRGAVARGAVWGHRGDESLLTSWARDDDGGHLDLVVWVRTRRTVPRHE